MAMELVQTMTKIPGVCFVCGSSPTREGHPVPSIDLNQDYDWGNNAYLCGECITLIANMAGYEDLTTINKRKDKISKLETENEELREKLEEQEGDLDKIREGSKAMKKVKAEA